MNTTLSTNFLPLATKLIGCPYVHGGKDPNGFDCWGLVWYFYKEMGIYSESPSDYATRSTFQSKDRTMESALLGHKLYQIEEPETYCLCVFSRNGLAIHCGIWLGENEGCLHATEFGVVCEKISTIKAIRNLNVTYYTNGDN